MSSPSPVEGPGNARDSQCLRTDNNLHPEYTFCANQILKGMETAGSPIRTALDPVSTALYQDPDKKPEAFNRMKSVTLSKFQNAKAFGCAIHLDKTNRFTAGEQAALMAQYESSFS